MCRTHPSQIVKAISLPRAGFCLPKPEITQSGEEKLARNAIPFRISSRVDINLQGLDFIDYKKSSGTDVCIVTNDGLGQRPKIILNK